MASLVQIESEIDSNAATAEGRSQCWSENRNPFGDFFASRGPGPTGILWWLNKRGGGRTDPKLRSNFISLNGLFNFLHIHMIIIYKFTVFSPFCFKVIPWRLLNLTPLEPKCPSSLQHPPTPSEFYLPRWRWRWKRQSLGVSGNSRWLHSLKHLKDNGSTQLRQRFSQLPPGAPCVVTVTLPGDILLKVVEWLLNILLLQTILPPINESASPMCTYILFIEILPGLMGQHD